MAKERIVMSKVLEVLRLSMEKGLSQREISRSVNVSKTTVFDILKRAEKAEINSWPFSQEISESELRIKLFPSIQIKRNSKRPEPDWSEIHKELMIKGVTLSLLWMEYYEENPNGYKFTMFKNIYRNWSKKIDLLCDSSIKLVKNYL